MDDSGSDDGRTPHERDHARLRRESRELSEIVDRLRNRGSLRMALLYAERALQVDRQLHGDQHNDVAADLLDLALIHFESGDPVATMECLQALDEADAPGEADTLPAWNRAHRSVQAGQLLGQLGLAERGATRVRASLPRLSQACPDEGRLAADLSDAANSLMEVGHHNDAEPLLLRSTEMERRVRGDRHPLIGLRCSNLATLYEESGRFEEAIPLQERAVALPPPEGRPEAIGHRRRFLTVMRQEAKEMGHWAHRRTATHEGREISYDLFISYNTLDEGFVRELDSALTRLGLTVWTFTKDPGSTVPRPDAEIVPRIAPHIRAARCFVVVSSRSSVTSLFVYEEIQAARQAGVPVLVLYPDGSRFIPAPASRRSDVSPDHLRRHLAQILSTDVYSYIGLGVPRATIADLADALLFRLLLMARDHPLHRAQDLYALRRRVRHGTRIQPIFCSDDGTPLPDPLIRRGDSAR